MLKESFRKYLEEAIGGDKALVAFSAFDTPASVSVRKNPFKKSPGIPGSPVPWSPCGVLLEDRPVFTLDPAFHAGAYYVQDSSSMFVGHILRQFLPLVSEARPLKVLDLCAAPGGKTTDIAASLREVCGDSFLLVSNEVMKSRAGILAENVALWGDPNVVVTNDDPKAFASLDGFFDVIIADVPCSGEGMFRKDEEAVRQWSEDNVALCAARQKRIVADVWNALADNGLFIYSTCTFNRFENDLNAEWIVRELSAEPLTADGVESRDGVIATESGYSLVPGFVKGEGQYCAAFRKLPAVASDTSSGSKAFSFKDSKSSNRTPLTIVRKDPMLPRLASLFDIPMLFKKKNDTYIAIPQNLETEISVVESSLHVIARGCAVGVVKGSNFVPDPDLALSIKLSDNAFPKVNVSRETALAFLHKDSMVLSDAPKGYIIISFEDIPLGFVKNLGSRCNNLHPQSRRIRMEIK